MAGTRVGQADIAEALLVQVVLERVLVERVACVVGVEREASVLV